MSSTFQLVSHARFVRRAMPFTDSTSCKTMNNWDGNTNIPAEKIDTSMHFGMKREVSKIMKSSKNDRNNNVMKIKPIFNTGILSFTTPTFVQTLPSYVPANSLAGHWPFSGNANDESGNNKNGNGATLIKDQFINL